MYLRSNISFFEKKTANYFYLNSETLELQFVVKSRQYLNSGMSYISEKKIRSAAQKDL